MNVLTQTTPKTAKALVFGDGEPSPLVYRRQLAHKINDSLKTDVDYSDQLKASLGVLMKVLKKPNQA